jgi:peptidyl-prolyl cis-trans isomerase B (cyclophilin B)
MTIHSALTAVLGMATSLMVSTLASAAIVVPVKAFVKPGEPLEVRFLAEKGDEGKKAVAALGLDAAKLADLFAPAAAPEVVHGDGTPAFTVYSVVNGEPLKASAAAMSADGTVNLAAVFPAISKIGTYYLVWQDATPLVIETLHNPVPWEAVKKGMVGAQQFTSGDPVITHIVPLEYALITTDKGLIKAKFSYDAAPHTIDNFIDLAKHGMYDNSAFHRIMKGFMIQGGDSLANSPDRAGTGGPGYEVPAEVSDKKHVKGTLSMARMGFSMDTAGSQFFIMHGRTPSLDGEYSAFGDVIDGLDIVDKIADTPSEQGSGAVKTEDRPRILSIKILPATLEMYGIKK